MPYIGGTLGMIPAVLATLAVGLWPAAIAAAGIFAYQEFESRVLVPRVYGQALRLSLLIGYQLLGVVGALLALPIAAGMRVLVEDMRIELPGEVPGKGEERAEQEQAEAVYAHQAQDASAVEAAQVATEIAGRLQDRRAA